jgi:hypothetical protein|tara:strand:- start:21 stop:368 length:348 start_codon:yes stop_codon:yes gene_type:complete
MAIPNQITIDSNNPTEIGITQPITTILEVITPGPQGPAGPKGDAGDGSLFNLIATGSVSASVELTGDIFTISSASTDIFSINYQGVVLIQENIITPSAVRGGIFFSGSGEFYLGS